MPFVTSESTSQSKRWLKWRRAKEPMRLTKCLEEYLKTFESSSTKVTRSRSKHAPTANLHQSSSIQVQPRRCHPKLCYNRNRSKTKTRFTTIRLKPKKKTSFKWWTYATYKMKSRTRTTTFETCSTRWIFTIVWRPTTQAWVLRGRIKSKRSTRTMSVWGTCTTSTCRI